MTTVIIYIVMAPLETGMYFILFIYNPWNKKMFEEILFGAK